MGKKMIALIGIGAGYVLARKEMRENPTGPVATVVNKITTNPTVSKASAKARQKTGEVLRKQGEAVTDKVADAVKERLFGGASGSKRQAEPEYVDIHVEEVPSQEHRDTPTP